MNKLRNSFLKLSKKFKRIIKIDGTKNQDDVHRDIVGYLLKKNVVKSFR